MGRRPTTAAAAAADQSQRNDDRSDIERKSLVLSAGPSRSRSVPQALDASVARHRRDVVMGRRPTGDEML